MKYMGSKSRICKYIVPIIQEYIDKNNIKKYWEPFVGGANVIDKIKCAKKVGSDKNKYLIALLNRMKQNGELFERVSKELYDRARDCFNSQTKEFEDWELGNIGFLASYNGRWFDGGYAKPGFEKTKNGERYRDYYQEAKNNLTKQFQNFIGIENSRFCVLDYKDYTPNGCVIYCDPPYANTKTYVSAQDFNHEEFWETMRKWSKNNVVLISEENAPEDFRVVWSQQVSRSIKANDKTTAIEKLFIFN